MKKLLVVLLLLVPVTLYADPPLATKARNDLLNRTVELGDHLPNHCKRWKFESYGPQNPFDVVFVSKVFVTLDGEQPELQVTVKLTNHAC
jgi:hypothetical protein